MARAGVVEVPARGEEEMGAEAVPATVEEREVAVMVTAVAAMAKAGLDYLARTLAAAHPPCNRSANPASGRLRN